MRRSVVVLPEPDGPSIVKNSPRGISRSIESTATMSPKVLRTLTSRMSASGALASGTSWIGWSVACVDKRALQDRQSLLDVLVRVDDRRQQPQDVPVDAARKQDQPTLPRDLNGALGETRCGLLRLLARDELEREHRPEAADLPDGRIDGRDAV